MSQKTVAVTLPADNLVFARHLFLHETLYARISLASSIVLIPRIVSVIYAKFHWAQRFRWLGTLLQHVAQ